MKRNPPPACDVVILALASRLGGFYAAGKLHAFVPEAPLTALLGGVLDWPGRIIVITDLPGEKQPNAPRLKFVRLSGGGASVGTALQVLARERLNADRCLLIDAAAPYIGRETLLRLARKAGEVAVATLSGSSAAVALGRQVLREASSRKNKAPDLGAWVEAFQREKGFGQVAAIAANEPMAVPLESTAQVLAGLNARRLQEALRLVESGLRLHDPASFDLRGRVRFGRNVTIDAHAILRGEVVLGDDVSVGPHCILENARIGAGTAVKEFTTVTDSVVGKRCRVGPFARIRPGCELGAECHIGNYVEIKTSRLGAGCKINHHNFIGDAALGRNVIIGAGSITCNYDGAKVQRTTIGDGAFVGSGVMLIAPIVVGRGAFVAAGSTVSKAAPARSLTIVRAKQVSLAGWKKKTSH